MNTNQLKNIGSEWTSGNNHRIYFNNLPKWYGLQANYYNSGNIQSATFRGEQISNSEAREYENKFNGCKVWFDLNTNEFKSSGFDQMPKSLRFIIDAITSAAQ